MVDLEQNEPLLRPTVGPKPEDPAQSASPRRPIKAVAVITASCMFLLSLVALTLNNGSPETATVTAVSRGKKEGVSEKVFRSGEEHVAYPWTNDMLRWQRTGFHFQPPKNWMNDPNGPLYHKGYYHIFYQWNPESAVWGNISWGHAVSTDLIHWRHLPLPLVPDQWYDINGVWSGAATILPDGNIRMLYTGDTNEFVQVQNLAYPANLSDPLLLEWVKYPGNPVITRPEWVGPKDFRDPTTAWAGPDGLWRVALGSRKKDRTGITLVYRTSNFTSYELVGTMHEVPGTGEWECADFYPVSTTSQNGLETSAYGPGIKHVLKASMDEDRHDYYGLGSYDVWSDKWVPDNPELAIGYGLRLDYGVVYASKTFYDQNTGRRIMWSWLPESDSEDADLLKGWASVQTIPRVVTYDTKTGTNILQWPIEELESLRTEKKEINDVFLAPGSVINLNITGEQLDVSAEFEVDEEALKKATVGDDVINNCEAAAVRQALGPFGVLVLADDSLSELTPVYFYVAKASDGTVHNWFCTDKSRSSKASGVDKQIYSGPVLVLEGEKYSIRVLVDHSVVEAFGQGGRTCITSRIYPTKAAINGDARVFLFNNATDLSVKASVNVWKLDSAHIRPF